jgi:ABC-type sugar transport system substrate-binding protein
MARVKVEATESEVAPLAETAETNNADDAAGEEDQFQGEDFHDWLARHGGLNGGWTHDDHMVMVRLTHR